MFKCIAVVLLAIVACCLGSGTGIAAASTQSLPLPSNIAAVEADLGQSPSPITKVSIDGSDVTVDIQGATSRSAIFQNVSKTDIAQIKKLANASGINVDESHANVFVAFLIVLAFILILFVTDSARKSLPSRPAGL